MKIFEENLAFEIDVRRDKETSVTKIHINQVDEANCFGWLTWHRQRQGWIDRTGGMGPFTFRNRNGQALR